MNTSFLNMFHDASDIDRFAITNNVNIDFNGIAQVLINQERGFTRDFNGFRDITVKLGVIINNFHPASAQNIRGPQHKRVANDFGGGGGFFGIASNRVIGLF